MTVPTLTARALAETAWSGPGALTSGVECSGARFHSPTPLVVHETLLGDGSTVHLCGTCRDNLALLHHLFEAHGGALPWVVRREHGNIIRALAERGYQQERSKSA